MNNIKSELLKIRNQVDLLIQSLDSTSKETKDLIHDKEIQEYIEKASVILMINTNQQVVSFISGVKEFAETTGFLSDKQKKSIDITLERSKKDLE